MRLLLPGLLALALSALAVRADPGDVPGSHDYPGFPRLPGFGFTISDYDEDNPSQFDFPVSRPLPTDASHIETLHVKGHRYVIRYEAAPGRQPSLLQTQQFYEKIAADGGFTLRKTGAVGDVNETFQLEKPGRSVWVYLEPSMTADVLTIVELHGPSPTLPTVGSATSSTPTGPTASTGEDPLYTALSGAGRVVLPLSFLPNKPDLDPTSQPLIDRIVRMLQAHPELALRIEGHTDNSGDPGDNQRLSAKRAKTVQAKLVVGGVDKNRLVAVGLGGLKPLADNATPEGRDRNRRIELVVIKSTPTFHPPAPNGVNYYPPPTAP